MGTCRQAKVVKCEGETLWLKYEKISACAQCHTQELCSMDRKEEIFQIHLPKKGDSFMIGDEVELDLNQRQKVKAIIIAYVLPVFLIFLFGYFLSFSQMRDELLALILIGSLVSYYILLYFCRSYTQRLFVPIVRKIK